MALRWFEGFEGSQSQQGFERLYDYTLDTAVPATTAAAVVTVPAGFSMQSATEKITTKSLGSVQNTWIFGILMRPGSSTQVGGTSNPYVALGNTDGEQIRVEFSDRTASSTKPGQARFELKIMRGATEIAKSVESFPIHTSDDAWIRFEYKITIDTASGSVEGRYSYVNRPSNNPAIGYTTLTWDAAVTSIDTQEQTSTGADRGTLSWDTGTGGFLIRYDDWYMCDSTGAKNNNFLGKVTVVENIIPFGSGADGDTVDWTLADASDTEDAWQEAHGVSDDDGRLTSDTLNEIHLAQYAGAHVLIATQNIVGVRKDIQARMETSGSLEIGHMWRKTTATAAQVESGTAIVLSSTTPVGSSVVAEDDPNTATDWVKADLDTYQFGVKNNG